MKPKVCALYNPKSGVHYHRLVAPLTRMSNDGIIDVHFIEDIIGMPDDATHFITSRWLKTTPEIMVGLMQAMKRRGVKVIIDVDDWWHVPEHNPSYIVYEKSILMPDRSLRGLRWMVEQAMQVADEVWVTHKYLAKKVSAFNKNTRIVPNGIDTTEAQWSNPIKHPSDALRFGYIAGTSHDKDIKACGVDLAGVKGYATNLNDYPKLLNAKPLSTLPANEYANLYRNIDVSIAPLDATEFNKCKSFLKALEAGFTNTAIIASGVHPYTSILNNKNSILVPHKGDWKKAIHSMSKQQAADLAGQLREDVQPYEMGNIERKFD